MLSSMVAKGVACESNRFEPRRELVQLTTSVAVIGLGYVGLPLARALATSGHKVTGYDLSTELVKNLSAGASHIEDVTNEDLAQMLELGFVATSNPKDLADMDFITICVPTPLGKDGVPDISFIVSAAESIARHLSPGTTVILESTTYPGTTVEIVGPILEKSGLSIGSDVFLAFSPERIDPGNKRFGLSNTPKIVGADDPISLKKAKDFYAGFVPEVYATRGTKEAETAKLLENTYRQVNIALANEFAKLCKSLEIDVWDVIKAASTKPFGFQAFYPGVGVGGHCIPIDPRYLSHKLKQESGEDFEFIALAEKVNSGMPLYVASRFTADYLSERSLDRVSDQKLLVCGVSYKPNSSDVRESPAVALTEELIAIGFDVRFLDPNVKEFRVAGHHISATEPAELSKIEFDAILVAQAHSEFLDPKFWAELPPTTFVFDATGLLPLERAIRL
jgi:nucleotide sugar dehydrogenase